MKQLASALIGVLILASCGDTTTHGRAETNLAPAKGARLPVNQDRAEYIDAVLASVDPDEPPNNKGSQGHPRPVKKWRASSGIVERETLNANLETFLVEVCQEAFGRSPNDGDRALFFLEGVWSELILQETEHVTTFLQLNEDQAAKVTLDQVMLTKWLMLGDPRSLPFFKARATAIREAIEFAESHYEVTVPRILYNGALYGIGPVEAHDNSRGTAMVRMALPSILHQRITGQSSSHYEMNMRVFDLVARGVCPEDPGAYARWWLSCGPFRGYPGSPWREPPNRPEPCPATTPFPKDIFERFMQIESEGRQRESR